MFATKIHIDQLWMNQLSIGLKRFHKVKQGVHACRCPFCSDSKKSSTKTRFYFYTRNRQIFAQCHNCGYSRTFYNFVKDYAPEQFEEYKRETLLSSFDRSSKKKESPKPKLQTDTKPQFKKTNTLKYCVSIDSLEEDHYCVQYLKGRGFNESHFDRFLFTNDFQKVAQQLDPVAAEKLKKKEPRLVIPFYDKDGNINLFQGRSFDPKSKLKYITIKAHDDIEKTYGLERVDWSKTTYAVEGPLDSIFVENCIATCDSNLIRSNADVLIFDNEPRNPEIVKLIESAIDSGRNVVIWPNSPDEKVDINDLIMSGVDERLLMAVIRNHTFGGIKAKLKFNQWRKV